MKNQSKVRYRTFQLRGALRGAHDRVHAGEDDVPDIPAKSLLHELEGLLADLRRPEVPRPRDVSALEVKPSHIDYLDGCERSVKIK